ncbi:hypothetical protein [Azospirillum sp. A39]|uniref:hypothetical protein n=1 Tax=Azospirillum sp. A39 TaxID=3462279 RepID=UPI0040461663
MSAAARARLVQYNGGLYKTDTNPYGFDGADGGVTGFEQNLPQALNDIGEVAGEVAEAAGAVGLGIGYGWDAGTTDADPGAGKIGANAALGAATMLYASTVDGDGVDVSALLAAMDDSTSSVKAMLVLRHRTDSTKWAVLALTGAIVTATGYRKLPVTFVAGPGGFVAGDAMSAGWVRVGDRGDPGPGGAPGLMAAASNAETQAGTATDKAVTPASLSSRTATETRTGLVELATAAEALTGTDTQRAVTPAGAAAVAAKLENDAYFLACM